MFTALLEGLIAQAVRAEQTDLSLVSVDSTTVRAHHDAAGLRVSKHLMSADCAGEKIYRIRPSRDQGW